MTLREEIEVVGKALGPEACSVRSRAAPLGLQQDQWQLGPQAHAGSFRPGERVLLFPGSQIEVKPE